MVAKRLALVAAAVVLSACGGSPPTHSYQVASVAMEPSLQVGDSIETVPPEQIQRGDVVVARFPDSDGTGSELRIYRVVGLPGERISATDRRVHINDKLLAEPYLPAGVGTESLPPTTIGADQYFLLGDNRDHSNDSRVTGTVARNSIVGVAVKIVQPKARAGPVPGSSPH